MTKLHDTCLYEPSDEQVLALDVISITEWEYNEVSRQWEDACDYLRVEEHKLC